MSKMLLATILALGAASAGAVDWPWQAPSLGKPVEYCRGFVAGGLASKQVSGMSRTDLWLAWSYVIRSKGMDQDEAVSEYQAGLDKFLAASDADAAASILQQADGDCGLDRTGLQITGW